MKSPQWSVPRAADFVVRDWDADGVLYDTASGDTHRLGALHLELLDLLCQHPRSCDALLANLADDLPSHLDAQAQRQLIERTLAELAQLSLIDTQAS